MGVEVSLYLYDDDDNAQGCRRPSIFRRYWPSGVPALAFGYRNDDIQSASEFASRRDRLYFDGRFPLKVVDGYSKWSLDASAGIAKVGHDNPSVFAPFIAREDTPGYLEAALVKHLKVRKYLPGLDLRFGYRWETNTASEIERYAYERDLFFFAVVFERYHEGGDVGGGSTGAGGSSSDRRGGDSGGSDPVDPEPGGGGG